VSAGHVINVPASLKAPPGHGFNRHGGAKFDRRGQADHLCLEPFRQGDATGRQVVGTTYATDVPTGIIIKALILFNLFGPDSRPLAALYDGNTIEDTPSLGTWSFI
jgi:hypothetical protein